MNKVIQKRRFQVVTLPRDSWGVVVLIGAALHVSLLLVAAIPMMVMIRKLKRSVHQKLPLLLPQQFDPFLLYLIVD